MAAASVSLRKDDELAGRVALVTGAARNIGRAIARSLAAGGAAIIVNANTSRDAAEETVALIEREGGHARLHMADVTDPLSVAAMVDAAVERFGRLDILVNNHTARGAKPFEEMTYEEWRAVVGVILDGTFICCRAAAPQMIRAGGGAIVNITGQLAHMGTRNGAHVSAAKTGVEGMTRAVALDLAPHGITVNCVAPGPIATVRDNRTPHRGSGGRSLPPAGRFGTPEEIAAMVRMLCGPEARFVTGQTIHVNGGDFRP